MPVCTCSTAFSWATFCSITLPLIISNCFCNSTSANLASPLSVKSKLIRIFLLVVNLTKLF